MFLRAAVTTILVCLPFYQANAQQLASPATISQIKVHTDNLVKSYTDLNWFRGNVLVTDDNNVIYDKSFGYSNAKSKILNNAKTKFSLGSIMKDFTKVLVLKQVIAGEIRLDDTLAMYELNLEQASFNNITVGQLIEHRSGFSGAFTAVYRADPLQFKTVSEKLEILKNEPLLFEPGTKRRYSNYGYIVLGAVLEKVSNKSFDTLLSEQIFQPLGLKNTSFMPDKDQPSQSHRYHYQFDMTQISVPMTEYPGPDGGVETTAFDLATFYRSLFFTNALVNQEHPAFKEIFNVKDQQWRAYGGGVGVSSAAEIDLKNERIIIVLANTDNLVAELISQRIHSFLTTNKSANVRALPTAFAYKFYQEHGNEKYQNAFQAAYKKEGYTGFIGRVINDLGMALIKKQQWQQGFDQFKYLIALFPKAPQAYDSLAFGYYEQGKIRLAQSTFAKALAIKPSFKSDYRADNYQIELQQTKLKKIK